MAQSSKTIGIILLGAALALMFWQNADQTKRANAYQELKAKEAEQAQASLPAADSVNFAQTQQAASNDTDFVAKQIAEGTDSIAPKVSALAPTEIEDRIVEELPAEELFVLENDFIKLTFTSRGGALREVSFKQYNEALDSEQPYTMVAPDDLPFLSFTSASKLDEIDLSTYKLVESSAKRLVFAARITDSLDLVREYTLTAPQQKRTANGYLLKQKISWVNRGEKPLEVPAYAQTIGLATPTAGDPAHHFLNFGYYTGKDDKFINLSTFQGGGFLFWSKEPQHQFAADTSVEWATVKNQFFTTIITPETKAIDALAKPVKLKGENIPANDDEGIAGFIKFDSVRVEPGATVSQLSDIYIGPKEFARINSLGDSQDKVMQWGWPIFSFFSKLFISMLNAVAHAVHNYGVAIVVLTLLIRGLMWPLTATAAKASKKMAAVQPALKELKEKYADKPEKLQKETMKLFQEYQINPLAGCLPSLLQIPVFIGFFYMLRSAAELRFESFLWISDLSAPDTIATIGGFPINPMPILMLVSMFYQIKLTPSSGDPQQRKIMMLTPFLFAFMLYGFSSGLTLYWTLSNLVSIIQQLLINRQQDSLAAVGADGKTININATKK